MKFPAFQSLTAVIAAVISMLVVAIATNTHGPALSPDSASYLVGAENLARLHGFVGFDNSAIAMWPPLFSTVIAIPVAVGFDAIDSARWINILLWGATVFLAATWLLRHVHPLPIALLGIVFVATGVPMLETVAGVWTETLHAFLVVVVISLMTSYSAKPSRRMLVLIALVSAAAFMTRWMGLSTIAGVGLWILYVGNWKRGAFQAAIIFGAISVLPGGLWMVRNFLRTETLNGQWYPGDVSLISNTGHVIDVATNWLPQDSHNYVTSASGFTVTVLLAVTVVGVLFAVSRLGTPRSVSPPTLSPIIFVLGVFLIYLVVLSTIYNPDQINNRLMSPVYIPIAYLAAAGLAKLWKLFFENDLFKRRAATGLIVLAASFFAWPMWIFVYDSSPLGLNNGLRGYSHVSAQSSETLEYLAANGLEGTIISNAAVDVYFFTGLHARRAPRAAQYRSSTGTPDDLGEFAAEMSRIEIVHIVWLFDRTDGLNYPFDQLAALIPGEMVMEFDDGLIFRKS